jgi:hypothetical protein
MALITSVWSLHHFFVAIHTEAMVAYCVDFGMIFLIMAGIAVFCDILVLLVCEDDISSHGRQDNIVGRV